MWLNYLYVFLSAFILGSLFVYLFAKVSNRYNLLIFRNIPLVGGIAIGAAFSIVCLAGFFLCGNLTEETIAIVVAPLIMLIFGVIDDLRELSIRAKVVFQIVATSLLVLSGIKTDIVFIWPALNIIITFIWIMGIANAFNHLDIMDGLAGSVAIVVGSALFTVSLFSADTKAAILTLALVGAVASFIIYNLPPAKIYMGNAGSHFLGFTLAAVALTVSYATLERKVALLSPLLILGFPIFDTTFLILMRIKRKRSIFKKSDDHLASRFLKAGRSKNKTLLFMLSLCLFFSVCGVFLSRSPNLLSVIIIISAGTVGLIVIKKMGDGKLTQDG